MAIQSTYHVCDVTSITTDPHNQRNDSDTIIQSYIKIITFLVFRKLLYCELPY